LDLQNKKIVSRSKESNVKTKIKDIQVWGGNDVGNIGADVCHLNLHKTFAIPLGGGGAGIGSISVAKHLVEFLPGHAVVKTGGERAVSAVASAPYGSAFVLPITYAYLKMMGESGLKNATKIAMLNANYIANELKGYFEVLYTGETGRCAHEMILDVNKFREEYGVEAADIARRLMDYGFHAQLCRSLFTRNIDG
jgi:glycine dehydrogenase